MNNYVLSQQILHFYLNNVCALKQTEKNCVQLWFKMKYDMLDILGYMGYPVFGCLLPVLHVLELWGWIAFGVRATKSSFIWLYENIFLQKNAYWSKEIDNKEHRKTGNREQGKQGIFCGEKKTVTHP